MVRFPARGMIRLFVVPMLLVALAVPVLVSPAGADHCGSNTSEVILCEILAHPDVVCDRLGVILGGVATFIPSSGDVPGTCVVTVTAITGTGAAGGSDQVFSRTMTTTHTFTFDGWPPSASDPVTVTGCQGPSGQPLTAAAAARIPACGAN